MAWKTVKPSFKKIFNAKICEPVIKIVCKQVTTLESSVLKVSGQKGVDAYKKLAEKMCNPKISSGDGDGGDGDGDGAGDGDGDGDGAAPSLGDESDLTPAKKDEVDTAEAAAEAPSGELVEERWTDPTESDKWSYA